MAVAVAPGIQRRAAELVEVVGRTADGMIALDPSMRIIGWNSAAAELLGHAGDEVLGRPCFEMLGWLDRYGNAVCTADCDACLRTGRDELIETREVVASTKDGRTVWLTVSTVVPPLEVREACHMIHFVREVTLHPLIERLVVERLGHPGPEEDGEPFPLESLTQREREIARLLAGGLDTREIAQRLVVSAATVRNHIQHILGKLGCHSRVELVALVLPHFRWGSGVDGGQAPAGQALRRTKATPSAKRRAVRA